MASLVASGTTSTHVILLLQGVLVVRRTGTAAGGTEVVRGR